MKRHQQLLFDKLNLKNEVFGGSLLKNSHAKEQRPVSMKRPMHLVLRSSKAKGRLAFLELKNLRAIRRIIKRQCELHGIKLYKEAIAGNHIHLIVRASSRRGFISFMRALSGLIPRAVLGLERGKRVSADSTKAKSTYNKGLAETRFWDQRPWTRIVSWGREFKSVMNYLELNILEAFGFIPYQPRKARYSSA